MGFFSDLIGSFIGDRAGQALNRRDMERLMEQEEQIYQRNSFQDQNNPFGSSSWGRTDDGRWVQTSEYSDDVQPLFDQALSMAGEAPIQASDYQDSYRPPGLSSLVQNQIARMGDRGGIDVRPEMAEARQANMRPDAGAYNRSDMLERMDDPRAGPPDLGSMTNRPGPLSGADFERYRIRPPRLRE